MTGSPDAATKVVVNDEEQYSIWPADRTLPAGWRATGFEGERQDCLDHIDEVWTDMRPLSLRRAMATADAEPAQAAVGATDSADAGAGRTAGTPVPDLVDRLSIGRHPVDVVLRPQASIEGLRSAIDDGYVHIRFTETQGGTELGVWLDRDACRTPGSGPLHLAGSLNLDLREVRCEADIDPETFTGTGRLYSV